MVRYCICATPSQCPYGSLLHLRHALATSVWYVTVLVRMRHQGTEHAKISKQGNPRVTTSAHPRTLRGAAGDVATSRLPPGNNTGRGRLLRSLPRPRNVRVVRHRICLAPSQCPYGSLLHLRHAIAMSVWYVTAFVLLPRNVRVMDEACAGRLSEREGEGARTNREGTGNCTHSRKRSPSIRRKALRGWPSRALTWFRNDVRAA